MQASAEAELDAAFRHLDDGDFTTAQARFLSACKGLHEARDVRPSTREKVMRFKERASVSSVQARLDSLVWETARRTVCAEHLGAQSMLLAAYKQAEVLWSNASYDKCRKELTGGLRRFDRRLAGWDLDSELAPERALVERDGQQMQACLSIHVLRVVCVCLCVCVRSYVCIHVINMHVRHDLHKHPHTYIYIQTHIHAHIDMHTNLLDKFEE